MRALVVAMLLSFAATAAADNGWERGVAVADRDRGYHLFTEGNDQFVKRNWSGALAKYEAALGAWDHPRIRLALARTLIFLGRPADAYDQIEPALRFGAAPFDTEEYAELLDFQKNLGAQLGAIGVTCTTEGARLTLDGQALLACPGKIRKVVLPGRHQIVGQKPGYATFTEEVIADPKQEASVTVHLDPPASALVTTTQRRWPRWEPWAVVGGGVAIALAGIPLQRASRHDLDVSTIDVAGCSPTPCPSLAPAIKDNIDRGLLLNKLAITSWVAGGVIVVGGAVLLYFNREETTVVERDHRISIAPYVVPGQLGFVIAGPLP